MTITKFELVLNAHLSSDLAVYRPTSSEESSQPSWERIEGEAFLALDSQEEEPSLRLRLVAHDAQGNPLQDPAWMVTAFTRLEGSSWTQLADRDTNAAHFLTDHFSVDEEPRYYRFTVSIPGSGISETVEVTIGHEDSLPSQEPDVVLHDDDFRPPSTATNSGNTPTEKLVAGDLGAPI